MFNNQTTRLFYYLLMAILVGACTHVESPEQRLPANWSYEEDEIEIDESLEPLPESSVTRIFSPSLFDWPVDEARLTRGYSPRPTGRRRRPHWGIDLAYGKGTPIYSSHAGKIIYAGRDFRGYGNFVLIENQNGWASLYAHLSRIRVKMGQFVDRGFQIGDMGRTGRASGVHLHFEIRKNRTPVDPLMFLPTTKVASNTSIK